MFVARTLVEPCVVGQSRESFITQIGRELLQKMAERRPLVLAFRESPYSLVHVENMRRATLAGAIVAPPTPASMARFLDAWCSRVARFLGIELPGAEFRWTGTGERTKSRPRSR